MLDVIGLLEPRQIILVCSTGNIEVLGRLEHKENIITVDWHMPCSIKPFMYAISIDKTCFSHKLIDRSNVFSVNFMSQEHKESIIECGRTSGQVINKFEITALKKHACETIDCVRIWEALGHLECEVVNKIDCVDHTIFIGKVQYFHFKKNAKRLFHLDAKRFTTTEEY